MDVSIAVSLIRGQMGAVVERAVNGAVETVLAEMLKVVGVKFEELKSQVALMKRDVAALQREKAQKERENDNIRAKLRYTELKLKYYRQGVEEELQQRASASTLVRIHPSSFLQAQRGGASSTEASPTCSTQSRTSEGPLARSAQECPSPHSTSRHSLRVCCPSDVANSETSDLLLPVMLPVNTPTESLDSGAELAQSRDQEDDCEWTVTLHPQTEGVDTAMVSPPAQDRTLDPGQQSAAGSLSPDGSNQADSSTLPSCALQVKQEVQEQRQEEEEEEEEEVICIKEEPEDVQEVMADLLLDCKGEQDHPPESEAQRSAVEYPGHQTNQRNHPAAFSSAGPSTAPNLQARMLSELMPQSGAFLQSMVASSAGQAMRPWTKDLSLYEEYKLRRNELRRRSINRRRELEKTLPQPLLADLVRERREKTRLRVARWRAKRKLQACINQDQAQNGTAGLSQTGFSISSQHQQLNVTCAATSSSQQRQSSAQPNNFLSSMSSANSISTVLPFTPSTSSSSLLLIGPNMAPHQHTVTSSSSSSSYSQVSLLQQSISLTDTDILQ